MLEETKAKVDLISGHARQLLPTHMVVAYVVGCLDVLPELSNVGGNLVCLMVSALHFKSARCRGGPDYPGPSSVFVFQVVAQVCKKALNR